MVDSALTRVAEDMIDVYGARASDPGQRNRDVIVNVLEDRGLDADSEAVDTVLRQIDWLWSA